MKNRNRAKRPAMTEERERRTQIKVQKRLNTIAKTYPENIFHKWGKGTPKKPGGSPILLAYKKGKIRIVK
jgi:hypothetical protein